MSVHEAELRELVPQVLSVLVRRGADFATAEDAAQEALIRSVSAWEREEPSDPKGWLITVAWRAFLDMARQTRRVATARRGLTPNRQRVRCRAPTTPCTSTSCAPIPS